MQWFITNMILLLIELLLLVECGYQQTKSRNPITRAERIVIVKLRTLVGVHDDRDVAVVWIWRGFASLERQLPV